MSQVYGICLQSNCSEPSRIAYSVENLVKHSGHSIIDLGQFEKKLQTSFDTLNPILKQFGFLTKQYLSQILNEQVLTNSIETFEEIFSKMTKSLKDFYELETLCNIQDALQYKNITKLMTHKIDIINKYLNLKDEDIVKLKNDINKFYELIRCKILQNYQNELMFNQQLNLNQQVQPKESSNREVEKTDLPDKQIANEPIINNSILNNQQQYVQQQILQDKQNNYSQRHLAQNKSQVEKSQGSIEQLKTNQFLYKVTDIKNIIDSSYHIPDDRNIQKLQERRQQTEQLYNPKKQQKQPVEDLICLDEITIIEFDKEFNIVDNDLHHENHIQVDKNIQKLKQGRQQTEQLYSPKKKHKKTVEQLIKDSFHSDVKQQQDDLMKIIKGENFYINENDIQFEFLSCFFDKFLEIKKYNTLRIGIVHVILKTIIQEQIVKQSIVQIAFQKKFDDNYCKEITNNRDYRDYRDNKDNDDAISLYVNLFKIFFKNNDHLLMIKYFKFEQLTNQSCFQSIQEFFVQVGKQCMTIYRYEKKYQEDILEFFRVNLRIPKKSIYIQV